MGTGSMGNRVIRRALENDAPVLSALAVNAKAYWGYSASFMDACRDELEVTPVAIARDLYYVLVERSGDDKTIIGFYGLSPVSAATADRARFEIDAMFVTPEKIRSGCGRVLINHAIDTARSHGADMLIIQSDPNAVAFYRAAGAVPIGDRESGSIPGRMLPLLSIDLVGGQDSVTTGEIT